LINLAATVSATGTKAVTFNGCIFDGGANGIGATGTNPIIGVRVANSFFINNSTNGIKITSANPAMTGVVSENNYFDSSVPTPILGMTGDNYSYGDVAAGTRGGIFSGSAKFGTGQTVQLSSGSTVIRTLANGAGKIDYSITDNSGNFRYGSMTYNNSGSVTVFTDEFTEPSATLGANLYANGAGYLTCTVTNASTLRYDTKQFI
jgi:hypothetical protein